jgi:AraC-like DNA-binding protein
MFKIDQPPLPAGSPLSTARNEMWLPRAGLAAAVRAVVARDSRGITLPAAQRYTYFPASPLCSITWFLHGDCHFVHASLPPAAESRRERLPDFCIGGPFTRPSCCWSSGEVHGLMLLLPPDALLTLTGLQAGDLLNRFADGRRVLDDDWQQLNRAVVATADDDARIALIEAFLTPRWAQLRPPQSLVSRLNSDWVQHLALRAANSGLGRSVRQVERRIKTWTGQSLRELNGMGRAERAFLEGVAAERDGIVNWGELADLTGYADQSHLCRQTRRVTGFTPAELRRRLAEDEGFWVYRLWGLSELHLRAD